MSLTSVTTPGRAAKRKVEAPKPRLITSVAPTRLSQVRVHVVERETAGEHEDLQVVQQLADLLGGPLGALVLGRHPDLARLLDHLLADRVDAGVQLGHGPRSLGAPHRLV